MTTQEFLTALYRGLLGREPDAPGLAHHKAALDGGLSPADVVRGFLASDECRRAIEPYIDRYRLDGSPRMPVDCTVDPADMQALWDHVTRVWARYGDTDPYYSVLTDERWRKANMAREEALDAFYATGRVDVARLEAWLQRNELTLPTDGVCVEYGCGVGRVTRWLASRFRRVVAVDVSQPHLDAARRRLTADGVTNVDYVHITGRDSLGALAGCDLFFSILVLQHNPPPIMLEVLRAAVAGLRDAGLLFFQVPTYGTDYRFSMRDYRRCIAERQDMELHFLPQAEVFRLAAAHGILPVEVQPDHMIGQPSVWLSSTFLLQKTRNAAPR